MASLMDIINKRKQTQKSGAASAEDLASRQQTQATGKAGLGGSGPAMSNVGAQMAATAGNAQIDQQNLQADIQNQGLKAAETAQNKQFGQQQYAQSQGLDRAKQDIAAQTQMADNKRQAEEDMTIKALTANEENKNKILSNGYTESLKNLASERGIAEQDIFMEAKRMRDEMAVEEYQSFLDQTAHVLAMTNQEYVDTLGRIGQESRLNDQMAFREEAQRLAFGQDMEILMQGFDQQQILNSDEREFQKMMAQMDMATAIKMAEQASKEAAYKQILTGATTLAVAGASEYSSTPQAGDANFNPETDDAALHSAKWEGTN